MRQQKFISKIRVGILLFFLFPLKGFSQDISGVWVGYMYNDTTQQTIHYELAINDVEGKTSGFSHTTFIIDSVKNIGVKEVKVKVKNEHVYVEDEKFVYDNYAEPAAKGVKMFSFLTLSKNDSAEVLSGIWRTNATRKYNPLTGSIFLLKKKKVEPQQTIIVKKLIELGFASQLAFLPPSVASQNNVAVNDKIKPASSYTSSEVKPLTKGKREFAQANNVTGNEQVDALNEASRASKNNPSSAVTAEPKQVKNDAENKRAIAQKTNAGNEQPVLIVEKKNETAVQTSNANTVAINQTTQIPKANKTSPAPITPKTDGEEANRSITSSQVKTTAKPSDAKDSNEKMGINQTTQTPQNNKSSPAPIRLKTDGEEANPSIASSQVKTSAKPSDAKEINVNTNSEVKSPAKPTDTKEETNNNTVAINEKIPNRLEAVPGNANSSNTVNLVSENLVPQKRKPNNGEATNQAPATGLESSAENKNESLKKQVVTIQKVNSRTDELKADKNRNVSSVIQEENNKENVALVSQQKVNTIQAQPNEASSSVAKQEIAMNDNKTEDLKQAETANQQKKVKINPLSNQQKPNTLEPTVVIKPNMITPLPAADLAKRKLETIRTVEIAQDSLVLSLYDNGSIDGDTVSVLMNGKVIMPRIGLLASAISKTVYLTPEMGDSVSVVMYAENLGSIPPNTGLLVIHDGPKIYEIRFSGDLNKNSKIILVRKRKRDLENSVNKEKIRLTQYSRGAGCGCKVSPQVLEEILHSHFTFPDENLLVGNSSKDDAAVYDLGDGTALISTSDFFMPIVDDAFDFGQIAAANAISDIYAMGGKPILAIALLGWPVDKLPASLAKEVMEGARNICAKAGIALAGGHSIDSAEPFFGLSVNGIVPVSDLKKNDTAKEGDILFLTKSLGVGILTTAQKRNVLKEEDLKVLLEQLTSLNSIGEFLGKIKGVSAMTDVTGFGLAGHLTEMAEGSGLSAELEYSRLCIIENVREYLSQRIVPDATYRNWNSYSQKISFEKGVNVMEAFSILPDPQTNGGLLISVDPVAIKEVEEVLKQNGLEKFLTPIGKFIARDEKVIHVLP